MTARRQALLSICALVILASLALAACSSGVSESSRSPNPSPSHYGGDPRAQLAVDEAETKRASVAEARARLTFEPVVPESVLGRRLLGIYTRADTDDITGGEELGGKDNVIQVLYEDDILIGEKRWNASVVPDEAAYGAGLMAGFPRTGEFIRTVKFRGRTLWLTDAVHLPESKDAKGAFLPGVYVELSQVAWFSNGVVHIVSSPTVTADELLPVAKTMVE